jgi:hypothetical protein
MFKTVRVTTLVCLGLLAGSWLLSRAVSDDDMSAVTPEREAAARLFAARHHSELSGLLEQLKETNPDGYEKAIQELFATSERLARLMERRPERYELELAVWKVDSRIRLLAARSAMGENEGRRQALKKLLLEKNDLRLQLLQLDRQRAAARLERLDASIAELQNDSEAVADAELERLLRSTRQRLNRQDNPPRTEAVNTNADK